MHASGGIPHHLFCFLMMSSGLIANIISFMSGILWFYGGGYSLSFRAVTWFKGGEVKVFF